MTAEIVLMDDRIIGIEALPDLELDRAAILEAATAVFQELATYCAEHGVLANLHRAYWFVDYDVSVMVDRITVQAPIGPGGPIGSPAGLTAGGFDSRMKAIER